MLDQNSQNVILFIICIILLFLIIIFGSLALINKNDLNNCRKNPIPYCYTDWKCKATDEDHMLIKNEDGTDKEVNMSEISVYGDGGIIQNCYPLTQQNLDNFNFVTEEGKSEIRYPEYERNIWDLSSPNCQQTIDDNCHNLDKFSQEFAECVANNAYNCPFYELGDVYWPACRGSTTSRYYTRPEIYQAVHDKSVKLKNSQ